MGDKLAISIEGAEHYKVISLHYQYIKGRFQVPRHTYQQDIYLDFSSLALSCHHGQILSRYFII